jgi:hypothetical protein
MTDTMTEIIIGNITKVCWHAVLHEYQGQYGHLHECYHIMKNNKLFDDYNSFANSVAFGIDACLQLSCMSSDKLYAIVVMNDKYDKMLVRNLFDSTHAEGFNQKNVFYPDIIDDNYLITDKNNLLLNYIQLADENTTSLENNNILYFAVEYETNTMLNTDLLNYCI